MNLKDNLRQISMKRLLLSQIRIRMPDKSLSSVNPSLLPPPQKKKIQHTPCMHTSYIRTDVKLLTQSFHGSQINV